MRYRKSIQIILSLILAIYFVLPTGIAFANGGARTEISTEPIVDENGMLIGEKKITVAYDENGNEISREVETLLTSSVDDEKGRPLSIQKITDGEKTVAPILENAEVKPDVTETVIGDFGSEGTITRGNFGELSTQDINGDLISDTPPEGYTEKNGVFISPDGMVIWQTEAVTDDRGNVCGYRTTITETETVADISLLLPEDMRNHFDELEITEKEDGSTAYRLVHEEILADGTKIKTVKTAESSTANTTKTTVQTIVKEYEKRVIKDGSIKLTVGNVVPDDNNGALTLSPVIPDLSIAEGEGTDVGGPEIMYFINPGLVSLFRNMYARLEAETTYPNRLVYTKTTPYYLFGNFSSFIYTEGHDFEMQLLSDADGQWHYAYCADRSVAANPAMIFKMVNADDMHYIDSKPGAEQAIKSIALNGFWNTAQNTGSLDAFKAWVRSLGYNGSFDALTEGVAEAVTQNAIWHYASSGNNGIPVLSSDPVWVYSNQFAAEHKLTDDDIEAYPDIYAKLRLASDLYQIIIANGDAGQLSSGENTELLMDEDLINPSLTVKEVKNRDNYTVDIAFVLDVNANRFSGDISVIAEYGEGLTKPGTITTNSDGKPLCEIKDVVLKNGETIKVKLTGMQELTKAAYFLVAESGDISETQTLVTIEEGERTLGFSFELKLEVEDPETQTVYKERSQSEASSSSVWHYEELTTYEYPQIVIPPLPPSLISNLKSDTYTLTVTEEIYGEAPKTDTFNFVLEFSNPNVKLPIEYRVQGSRYSDGETLKFTEVNSHFLNQAGTGSGNVLTTAKFTLGHGEEIIIFDIPDGTQIKIVQTGDDERYETKIDKILESSRTADRVIQSANVIVDYANGYYSDLNPDTSPSTDAITDKETDPELNSQTETPSDPKNDNVTSNGNEEKINDDTPLDNIPRTGDPAIILLWISIAAISLLSILALFKIQTKE